MTRLSHCNGVHSFVKKLTYGIELFIELGSIHFDIEVTMGTIITIVLNGDINAIFSRRRVGIVIVIPSDCYRTIRSVKVQGIWTQTYITRFDAV